MFFLNDHARLGHCICVHASVCFMHWLACEKTLPWGCCSRDLRHKATDNLLFMWMKLLTQGEMVEHIIIKRCIGQPHRCKVNIKYSWYWNISKLKFIFQLFQTASKPMNMTANSLINPSQFQRDACQVVRRRKVESKCWLPSNHHYKPLHHSFTNNWSSFCLNQIWRLRLPLVLASMLSHNQRCKDKKCLWVRRQDNGVPYP